MWSPGLNPTTNHPHSPGLNPPTNHSHSPGLNPTPTIRYDTKSDLLGYDVSRFMTNICAVGHCISPSGSCNKAKSCLLINTHAWHLLWRIGSHRCHFRRSTEVNGVSRFGLCQWYWWSSTIWGQSRWRCFFDALFESDVHLSLSCPGNMFGFPLCGRTSCETEIG